MLLTAECKSQWDGVGCMQRRGCTEGVYYRRASATSFTAPRGRSIVTSSYSDSERGEEVARALLADLLTITFHIFT